MPPSPGVVLSLSEDLRPEDPLRHHRRGELRVAGELFGDAGVLSGYADCILYVVRHDFVQRRRILDGIAGLEESKAEILGYAFNDVPVHRGGYGYYGYGRYGYGKYGGRYGSRYGGDNQEDIEVDTEDGR